MEHYPDILDHIDAALWTWDTATQQLTFSSGIDKVYGYSREDFIRNQRLWYEIIYEEDIPFSEEHYRLMEAGQSCTFEHRIYHPSGEIRWIRCIGKPVKNNNNQVVRLNGIVIDITEKKVAQAELEKNRVLLQSVLDWVDVAIWSCDNAAWEMEYVSEAIEIITGYPSGYFTNINRWKKIIHPADIHLFERLAEKVMIGIKDFGEYRIIHANGEIRWVQNRIIPSMNGSGRMTRLVGAIIDITSRRKMEEALHRSEQRYKSLFEYNSDVICEVDMQGNLLSINPAAEAITGDRPYDKEDNFSHFNLFDADTLAQMKNYYKKAKQGHQQSYEVTSRHKNGKIFHWETKQVPIFVNNEIVGVYMIFKNMTAKKEIEKELADQEEKYRLIACNMTDLMAILDIRGIIRFAAPSCQAVLGYDFVAFTGSNAIGYVHPEDIESVRKQFVEIVRTKSNKSARCRLVHADGHSIHVDCMYTPVLGQDGQVESVILVSRDVTDKVRMENALVESEERYRRLIELSPQPITSHCDGILTYINPAGVKLLGAEKAEDIVGRPIFDVIHPDYSEMARHRLQLLYENNYVGSLEYRMIRFDGSLIDVEFTSIFDRKNKSTLTVINDITERKKIERALQKSEERYRRMVELSPVGIAEFKNDQITYLNSAGLKLLGANSLDDLNGILPLNLIHPHDKDYVRGRVESALMNGYSPPGEYRVIRLNGDVVDVSVIAIYDTHLFTFQMVLIDISSRKQAERALLESEERYYRLQTSLDRLSHDLFGVMKVSEMESRLVKEVRHVLKTTNVNMIEVERDREVVVKTGNADLPQSLLEEIQRFDHNAACEIIESFDGYFIKIADPAGKKYILCIGEKLELLTIPSIRIWLVTITRYISVLYDNFQLIEDLTQKLERLASQQAAPSWLLRLLFNLSENERKRLSQDLHDAALQEQIIWYRKIDLLQSDPSINRELREQLQQIAQGLLDVIYQIRITCNELRPPLLKEEGLISAVEALFEFTQLRSNYSIHFDAADFRHTLNDDQLIGLYRIIQELLANATKHSNAANVRIRLSSQQDQIQLSYEDDGVGMNLNGMKDSFHSMGMYGMKERVRSMDGKIEFHSSPNNGLDIYISIPFVGKPA